MEENECLLHSKISCFLINIDCITEIFLSSLVGDSVGADKKEFVSRGALEEFKNCWKQNNST